MHIIENVLEFIILKTKELSLNFNLKKKTYKNLCNLIIKKLNKIFFSKTNQAFVDRFNHEFVFY
jgi:hypothetical protein